jgi:hypothetical protein
VFLCVRELLFGSVHISSSADFSALIRGARACAQKS